MNADLPFDIVELTPCPMISVRQPDSLRETAFRGDAWLPEDVERLRSTFYADAGFDEIEAATGRSPSAVRSKIAELGLRRNSARPWGGFEDEELARRYGGEAASSIASDLGRSVAAVYARATALDLTERAAPPYTEWEIAQIRAGYAASAPVVQIAVLIGRPLCGVASLASDLHIVHAGAPPDWSPAEQQRALELAEAGRRYRRIATDLHGEGFPQRSHVAVGQTLRKLGYGRGWGRPWTVEEDDLLRGVYERGTSLTPLRTRLGRSPCSIRWRARELNLQGTHAKPNGWRTEPPWTPEQIAVLGRDYGRVPTPQLSANLGRTKGSVFNKAHQLRLAHGFMRAFSKEEDDATRIAHANGVSLTDLSWALGRDPAVVSKHAIRIGVAFAARSVRAPRGRLAERKRWTLQDILALAARRSERVTLTATPARTAAPCRPEVTQSRHQDRVADGVAGCTLVAGPGVPTARQAVLAGMLAAGLLASPGAASTRVLLPAPGPSG